MGKKVKKRSQNLQKANRVVPSSDEVTPKELAAEAVDDKIVVVKERKPCVHIDKAVDLSKLSARIGLSESVRCEDCREGGSKGKGKHGKKKGTGVGGKKSKRIWVCLECGHFACGGVGLPTNPQSHAQRHACQSRHHYVVQLENLHLCWCFQCNSLIPVGKSEEDGEQKDVLLEAVKLIKERPVEKLSGDVEDIWFGTGSILGEIKSEASNLLPWNEKGGYVARGLVNLGNTCFFNSIMQNFLAMDQLRDYFMKLDQSVGPLTMALKKLFNETSPEADSRHVINPKALFGCICAKAPQFRGYQQQDSHELLRFLLDGLFTEETNARKLLNPVDDGASTNLGPTFVDAIFGGQLSSTVTSTECGHSSVVSEPFFDLSLSVPTKKPSPKRASLISRSKRTKLPLKKEVKKGGKIRGKGKTTTSPVFSESLASQPGNKGSLNVSSSPLPFKEETVDLLSDSWLDYLEADPTPDDLDSVSQIHDISTIQDSESNDATLNDGMLQSSSEVQGQVCSQNMAHELDLDVSDGKPLENYPLSQVQGSEVLLENLTTDKMVSKESEVSSSMVHVQSSEIILLPYKEEVLITEEMVSKENEASLSMVGCAQDTLEFDGFGGLFNEPEVDSASNAVSGDPKEVAETGLLPGNSSESDPNEVDDTDAPVSVDSCLADFTKPELLSKEHAWHCESCSKALQAQKVETKENQQKNILKNSISGSQLISQCDPSDSDAGFRNLDNESCETAVKSLEGCAEKLGDSIQNHVNGHINLMDKENSKLPSESSCHVNFIELPQSVNGLLNSDHTPEEVSSYTAHSESSNQSGIGDQTSQSCNMNDPESISNSLDQVQSTNYHRRRRRRKSEDNEEVDSKCFKVMREATKRYLINKVPSILTIHLKRFSQDPRGRLSKLGGHVNFRDTIDLSPYVDSRSSIEKNKYDYRLIGVVEHSGTMRGGHYVAYVRGNANRGKTATDLRGSTWYYASDGHIREVSLAEVLRCEAYILFYERV